MEIALVILNWNGVQLLEEYLPSVIKYSEDARIIVADNASSDNSIAFLKKQFPKVELIQNKENGGFAKGYNQALKKVNADYYILLNSDIEVTENWIQPVIQYMISEEKMVACQPKILSKLKPNKFEHAGAAGGFLDKFYFPFCRGRIFQDTEEDLGQYNSNQEVFWATGACLFIEAKAFHEAGGFDERFFAHMEEIDLCWRLKNNGNSVGYCGDSTVYHLGGGTLNYMTPKKTYLNFRNSLFMITKNYRGSLFTLVLYRLLLDGIAGIRFLLMGEFKHLGAILKAHFHYYKNLNHFLKIRKENISKSSGKENNIGYYKKSIVMEKFLKKHGKYSDLKQEDFIR